ncbi:MAG: replication restart helicase PriA [Bacteroidota bacterium]
MTQTYADIVLPLAVPRPYTYHVPEGLAAQVSPGKRVVVQFGKRKYYTGLIWEVHNRKPDYSPVKDLTEVLDEAPVLIPFQQKLWEWIAHYYMACLGDLYKAALPAGLKMESDTYVFYHADEVEIVDLGSSEMLLLDYLREQSGVRLHELRDAMQGQVPHAALKRLVDKGLVIMQERLRETYKAKEERILSLPPAYAEGKHLEEAFLALERAPKQLEVLMKFLQTSRHFSANPEPFLKRSQFLKLIEGKTHGIKALVDKGFLKEESVEVSRLSLMEKGSIPIKDLSPAQQEAKEAAEKGFSDGKVVLLHGVTSSGKTEIYIHLINAALKKGEQVLYLLPEIALTTQIIQRLKAVFGDKVGIYHSKFSDAERVETYHNLLNDEGEKKYQVILGVRSSIFLPFDKLGLIIVDEEHENSYKQYDPAPRYHARDAAIVLARYHGAQVLLGTATPSIESYFNARAGKYHLVELFSRYQDIKLPQIVLADTQKARRQRKMKSIFTADLFNAMNVALENKEQVILFQNRRGFSPYVECEICGWIPRCNDCDVSLTYHKYGNKLVCHYCGHAEPLPVRCGACGSHKLATKGFGTEKIEDEVQLLFPKAKVARLDLDATRKKHAYQQIIGDFQEGHIDVLIGTQMVSKGLDFDRVHLVGILNADNLMFFPDFRAYERSFQLLAQVSGRAGRKHKQGKVFVQTNHPEHSVLKQVLENDYLSMYKEQLIERKSFAYPPFYRLIEVTLKHKDEQLLRRATSFLAPLLQNRFPGITLGPQKPLIGRIQTYHILQFVLKVPRSASFQKAKEILREQIDLLEQERRFGALRINLNVDPY